jgi:hypothetical protein
MVPTDDTLQLFRDVARPSLSYQARAFDRWRTILGGLRAVEERHPRLGWAQSVRGQHCLFKALWDSQQLAPPSANDASRPDSEDDVDRFLARVDRQSRDRALQFLARAITHFEYAVTSDDDAVAMVGLATALEEERRLTGASTPRRVQLLIAAATSQLGRLNVATDARELFSLHAIDMRSQLRRTTWLWPHSSTLRQRLAAATDAPGDEPQIALSLSDGPAARAR